LFKRKQEPPASAPAPRPRAQGTPRQDSDAGRARQREIARATAAKIDAIELEMASDMFGDEPAWGSTARRAPAAATNPAYELGAAELAAGPGPGGPAITPVAEEAAVLYANGETLSAERALRASLVGIGRNERMHWWMLFDLYQLTGREQEFESIAIDYAIHFETAPPLWKARTASSPQPQFAGITPTEAFSGVLGPHIEPQLQRLAQCSASSPVLRLEFGGVRGATPEGCASLLDGLRALRRAGSELVLGSADTLAGVLRPLLVIGERGASKAPWLLLLELLQLLELAKDFDETAMDYRVTFETEPPAFEPPVRVAAAAASAAPGDRFLLPAVVEGDSAPLLASIESYARAHDPAVLDCSRLERIDYPAAEALAGRLRSLKAEGRALELRELNHLVGLLLRLLGAGASARLFAVGWADFLPTRSGGG
jgi:ABC-type transporter Mla MlaB component